MTGFDRFVGIDWSGAKGMDYAGVAVAECDPGGGCPRLAAPPGRRWRRSDVVSWLVARVEEGHRVLAGIDCSFALPEPVGRAALGDGYGAGELWDHVDRLCADAPDLHGGDFALLPAMHAHFWHAGKRPAGFAELHRATELACRQAGLGHPESPLKLIGARQAGKGGLAGMRALAETRRRLGSALAVWPFDRVASARLVLVELYPRLFLRVAGHGNGKARTIDQLDRCLAALESEPYGDPQAALSDHDTDALVASAGLRQIADDDTAWTPSGLDHTARRAEGWIFGVR